MVWSWMKFLPLIEIKFDNLLYPIDDQILDEKSLDKSKLFYKEWHMDGL